MDDHERCDACGFDGDRYSDSELLEEIEALGMYWHALLDRANDRLRTRPERDVWSPIEYAAHSRDITALHEFGVEQALIVEEPVFEEFAEGLVDEAAARYGSEDPASVVDALSMHASRLAALARDAGGQAWSRGLTVGNTRSTVRRLLEHALHDAVHHLDDVERGLLQS